METTNSGMARVEDWYLSVSDESVTEIVKESGRDASGFIGHGLSFSADREIMLCPLCGFPYVHLGRQVNIPGGYYEAAPKMVRGGVTAIPSSCENGHDLVICFGSHKGNVVVWSIIVKDGDGSCSECGKDSDCMDGCSCA